MTREPVRAKSKYLIKHTTRTVRAIVKDVQYQLDVNTLHRNQNAEELKLNEIGRVRFRTTQPLLVDTYERNRTTGSFVIIDESSGNTVGAGTIL